MKATLKTGAAGLDIEAVDGIVSLTLTRIIRGEGDRPDRLQCVSTTLTTEEAASFADVFVGMACIAEEQAYHRDIDRTFAACGIPVPARDLAVWARNTADASQAGDELLAPAYFGEVRP